MVAKVCCTSHGQPPSGSRRRAMIVSSVRMSRWSAGRFISALAFCGWIPSSVRRLGSLHLLLSLCCCCLAADALVRHSRESGRLFHGRMSVHPATFPCLSHAKAEALAPRFRGNDEPTITARRYPQPNRRARNGSTAVQPVPPWQRHITQRNEIPIEHRVALVVTER